MKTRDVLTLIGGIMLGVGTFTLRQDVPKWAWWTANFGTIIGPILMSVRAMTAGSEKSGLQ